MTDQSKKSMYDEADDLVFEMRELHGTNDIESAVSIAKKAVELLNDASAYDRQLSDDDEELGLALGYVLDQVHLVMDNIQGVPKRK